LPVGRYPNAYTDSALQWRKLTVKECCRLQTLPDDYCKAVSNSQAYKILGNGWTNEVIKFILKGKQHGNDRTN
jgi:DNA (cytosine-5)-methyltransferase 3A